MSTRALGKTYRDGEIIIRQGEVGDCMYIVQEGQVEVVMSENGQEVRLALLGAGEVFGETALLAHEVRNATVRVVGGARVLSMDRKNFMRRIHEDPSVAYRLVKTLSGRVHNMSEEVAQLKTVESDAALALGNQNSKGQGRQ